MLNGNVGKGYGLLVEQVCLSAIDALYSLHKETHVDACAYLVKYLDESHAFERSDVFLYDCYDHGAEIFTWLLNGHGVLFELVRHRDYFTVDAAPTPTAAPTQDRGGGYLPPQSRPKKKPVRKPKRLTFDIAQ